MQKKIYFKMKHIQLGWYNKVFNARHVLLVSYSKDTILFLPPRMSQLLLSTAWSH